MSSVICASASPRASSRCRLWRYCSRRSRRVLEAGDRVGEARCRLGEVGRVDLLDIAETHDLRARTRARNQRLHLLRGQVLRLVDDQIAIEEGAAAHEVHRANLDARGKQI